MKKKFISESIEEAWVSTDTGAGLYSDDFTNDIESEDDSMPTADLDSIIPPADIRLNPDDFEMFVNQLIEVLPENPTIAVELFRRTIKAHPYLTQRPVGFASENPYENTLDKFISIVNNQK